jgi:hypothetical protein
MSDTTESRTAANPPPRRTGGWGIFATIMGLGFLGFGAAMIVVIAIKAGASAPGSPLRKGVFGVVGLWSFFLLVGLASLASGLSSITARLRLARLAAAHPGEPWYADFEWNPEGQRERVLRAIMGPLVGVGLVGIGLLPFNYGVFGRGGAPWAMVGILIVADLVVLAGAAWVGLRVLRKLRFGGAFIRYARFPFFMGERLDVRVGTRRPPPAGVIVTARLRVIEERLRTPISGPAMHDQYQIYLDETTVVFDGVSPEVSLTFPLPEGDYLGDRPPTELMAHRHMWETDRRWWELGLKAKMHGVDFDEDFVVPVYRRP